MKDKPSKREKQQTEEDRLLQAARRGELQLVFRWIMTEKHSSSEYLLHNVLKFRNVNEAQLLAVLRSDPQAASRPNQVGQFPLHSLAIYTSWPSVTMIRALAEAWPPAAQTPDNAGWLPLHYLCKNALARGESEPRATPATLRTLRAFFPQAARTSLPDEKNYGQRTPSTLFGRTSFKNRDLCEQVLDDEDDQICIQIESENRKSREERMAALLQKANAAADRGDALSVAASLKQMPEDGSFSGFSDVRELPSGRYILHRCLERCGHSINDNVLISMLAASPIVAYMPDAVGALPLHVLLSSCETDRLTVTMVKALIEANPRSCEQAGPRGWNCLHYWANRDPNDTHSQAILNELLATHSGRKALRIPDAKGELPLHLFVKTCSAYKFAKEEEEFHGGLTADYSDDDSTADYSDDDSSANEIREKESTYSFLGLGSKKNNKINDNSLKEIDDTSDSGWDTRRPLVLARKLLTTYTDSWRIKSNDGTTPMDLAPVEIKELFHEFIQECEMVQARKRAKIRQQLAQEKKNSLKMPPLPIVIDSGNDALLLSILSEKANAGARNNKAITKRKLQQQLNECAASLRDLVIADDSYQGGTLLHRLLRRTNHNVSSEALRALLSAAPEACTITDKSQWTCLHLLVRRACDDHSIGTAGNLKRLARASPEAALVLGGGPRRNWTPLHVLCTMLSRHNCQRPPATGEERKTFDDRAPSVFKTLLQIGGVSARLLKDARGKTAYDILPVAGYYDVFRGLCFPPEDDALQKEEEAFCTKVRRKSSCSVQSILATNMEGSTFKPEEKRDENKVSRQRRPVRKISRRALIHDAPCVSLNLPGLELSQVSRPSTPQAVESLPEVIVKARPASERDTLHKAKAREAERWITDQVRRQRAAESAKLRIERAERRAHLKANAQAKRKARREKRQLEDNFTDVSMMVVLVDDDTV